jgi:serine/threonine protein kinase/tetratricopeptide (TPR) repeat protein
MIPDESHPWRPPHLRLVKLLGAGGMGEVWLAEKIPPPGMVAIKHLTPGLGGLTDEDDRLRFKREFLILSRLDYPAIIRAYEQGESAGGLYYTMDFVDGLPMQLHLQGGHWRKNGGGATPGYFADPRGLEQVQAFGAQLLAALAYLHSQSIIHRDLKPDNIMIDAGGQLRLIDFGLARRDKADAEQGLAGMAVTQADQVVGTPGYFSPEAIRGVPLDARCDLYSTGVILYELAAGRRPFVADNAQALMMMHVQQAPLPPERHNPALSREFNDYILRLLHKEPDRRFSTALEARRALLAFAASGLASTSSVMTVSTHPDLPVGVAAPQNLLVAPFIGNLEIRKTLAGLLGKLRNGEGGLLLAGGAPGAGKSRLADEARIGAAEHEIRHFRGAAREEGGRVGELLQGVMQGVASLLRRNSDYADLLNATDGAVLARHFPVLRECVESRATELDRDDPPAEKAQLMGALYGLFRRLAERHRVIIVLEDLHWADALSLELAAHLIRSFTTTDNPEDPRLLILATYRSDGVSLSPRVEHWLSRMKAGATAFVLQPLSAGEAGQLIQAAMGLNAAPPASFLDRMMAMTGGNPLFVIETLKSLVGGGELQRNADWLEDGGWNFSAWLNHSGRNLLVGGGLPDTVQDALHRRLFTLPQAARDALCAAALIGREFHFSWWRQVGAVEEDALLEIADGAVRVGILEEAGGEWFRFSTDQWRALLAAKLLAVKRRRLHPRIVAAIEIGGQADDFPSLLAEHAIQGGLVVQSLEYGQRCVTALLQLKQADQAQRMLDRLVGFLPGAPAARRLAHCRLRMEALSLAGDNRRVVEEIPAALELARGQNNKIVELELLRRLASAHNQNGNSAAALAASDAAIVLALQLQDETGQAWALYSMAVAQQGLGRKEVARKLFDECERKAARLTHLSLAANVQISRGILAWENGELTAAKNHFDEAVVMAEQAGEPAIIATATGNSAEISLLLGELADAEANLRRAARINREIGLRLPRVDNLNNLGQFLLLTGRPDEARLALSESLREAVELSDPYLEAFGRIHFAKAMHALGDREEAMKEIDAAIQGFRSLHYPFGEAVALVVKIRFVLDQGDHVGVAALAAAALELARPLGLKNTMALAISAQALAQAMAGDPHDQAAFENAAGLARESQHVEVILVVAYRHGLSLIRSGASDAGCRLLEETTKQASASQFIALASQIDACMSERKLGGLSG